MQSAITVSATQLRSLEGPFLKWQGGSAQAAATGVGQPGTLKPAQLAFVANREFLEQAKATATLLILEEKMLAALPLTELKSTQAVWTTPSLKAAMVVVLPLFDPRQTVPPASMISHQAFVHPTAQVGQRTRIDAGAYVGAGAVVGDDCHLHPGAVVEDFCQVGHRCLLNANCVIGSEGFGFATDPKGGHHKIPQIGIAVLEDDVEIGAGCAIDRATIGETRIGKGSKFDNLCHVAHNCKIGPHSLFAGGAMVAGSTEIGAHFMVGGGTRITDHIKICDRVIVGGMAGVTKDVTEPGAYTGYPLEPMKDGLRTLQNLTHLTEMRKRLKTISKKLGLDSEES